MTMPAGDALPASPEVGAERERRAARVALGLAAAVGIAVVVPYLRLAFAGEHGHYSFGAWLMRRGGLPYRDLWDNNAPAAFALHWISELVFGHGMASIRWFDLGWTAATLAVLFGLARRVFGELAGALSLLFATALYFTLGHQATAQRDGFCVLPLLVMLRVVFEAPSGKRGDTIAALAVGLGTGCIFWLKPPLALAGGVCALAALARPGAKPLRGLAALAFGFLLPTALVLIPLGMNDLLGDFYDAVVRGNLRYTQQRYPLPLLLATLGNTAAQDPLLAAGVLGLILGCRLRTGRWVAAVALACLVSVLVQGKLLPYHMVPLLFLLWMGAAYAAAAAFCAQRRRVAARLASLAVLALAAWRFSFCFQIEQYPLVWASWRPGGTMINLRREESKLAALVARESTPSETILVWGVGTPAIVHYLAGRRSPTRFAMNYLFSRPGPDDALTARWRMEFMTAVRAAPPRVVVVVGGDARPAIGNLDSTQSFERFSALRDFVQERYALVGQMTGRLRYDIYRRSD